MAQKPAIPKGTRDFLPTEVAKRNYMFATIKEVFRRYGSWVSMVKRVIASFSGF